MSKQQYQLNITSADNGIIVQIGCKTLVFSTPQIADAMLDITGYLTGGQKAYQRLYKKYFPEDLNKALVERAPEPCNTYNDCAVQEAPRATEF